MQVACPAPLNEFLWKKSRLYQQITRCSEEFAVEMSDIIEKVGDYAP